ncbi:hypothetical protein HU200_021635 [Digitaria exilis]|uniref:RING-type E3 ubiquitin transferase n=1 Tax=Digitaria exilis TaxID=1010633 RepID=A0A835EZE2_9POAL|nr:hypothetical protein HU200_021635 [Digitaria exilis]
MLCVCMLCCLGMNCKGDRQDQEPEAAEQMVARTVAEWEALAARAEAALAAAQSAAAPPPLVMPLPYFPYSGGASSETVVCSICLEPLRQWQLCSEVPVCRHVFHRECLGEWVRSSVKLDDGSLGAPVVLPHFPYTQQAGASSPSSEPVAACAICLDELRQGELCSEVPACHHIFHESCIRAWTKKMNSCPLCRAKIVPGGAPAAADDVV